MHDHDARRAQAREQHGTCSAHSHSINLPRIPLQLDLDDLSIDNAYFRSFDMIVRRMLDPVWHKVGPRTKQLVGDLATLRRLLTYLLTYDALAFHAYLETLIAANTTSDSGSARQHQSPWMLTDAAHTIFTYAKRRCYVMNPVPKAAAQVINLADDDDEAWAALDEVEGRARGQAGPSNKGKEKAKAPRKKWLPEGMEPVLEELPKWYLLADILHEIEGEAIRLAPLLSSRMSFLPVPPTVCSRAPQNLPGRTRCSSWPPPCTRARLSRTFWLP